jgi:hypothetical protein
MLRTVDVIHRVHRAFKAFDNPDQDLARFLELWIFAECDHVLVPWPRDLEPWLA